MSRHVVSRLLLSVPTLIGISSLVFFLIRILPGDLALLTLLGPDGQATVSEADLAALRHSLGIDRPILEQYASWMWALVHLDLGNSLISGRPVGQEIGRLFPVTLELATLTTILSALLAIPSGVLMAVRQGTWVDYVLRAQVIAALALPNFVAATLFILIVSTVFTWMPSVGSISLVDAPLTNIQRMLPPALILSLNNGAILARMVRSSLLEVLHEDYLRTARAKGLSANVVISRHALKNALLPVVTLLGLTYIGALNGSVIMESIFTLPGLGSALVHAVSVRDYTLVQGIILVIALIVFAGNLTVDLMYQWLDPRITQR